MNITFSRFMWLDMCNNSRLTWLDEFVAYMNDGGSEQLGFGEPEIAEVLREHALLKELIEREKAAQILGNTRVLPEINRQAENLLTIIDGGMGFETFGDFDLKPLDSPQ